MGFCLPTLGAFPTHPGYPPSMGAPLPASCLPRHTEKNAGISRRFNGRIRQARTQATCTGIALLLWLTVLSGLQYTRRGLKLINSAELYWA